MIQVTRSCTVLRVEQRPTMNINLTNVNLHRVKPISFVGKLVNARLATVYSIYLIWRHFSLLDPSDATLVLLRQFL